MLNQVQHDITYFYTCHPELVSGSNANFTNIWLSFHHSYTQKVRHSCLTTKSTNRQECLFYSSYISKFIFHTSSFTTILLTRHFNLSNTANLHPHRLFHRCNFFRGQTGTDHSRINSFFQLFDKSSLKTDNRTFISGCSLNVCCPAFKETGGMLRLHVILAV